MGRGFEFGAHGFFLGDASERMFLAAVQVEKLESWFMWGSIVALFIGGCDTISLRESLVLVFLCYCV